jgi:gliding motility associated protien GldN
MKRFCFLSTIFLVLALTVSAQNNNPAQPRVSRGSADRSRTQQPANADSKDLSVRAQILNEQLTQDIGNARWMRVVMRELDLTNEKNAPLYYPLQESNGTVNLFTTLFRLISEGKINVYKYNGDYESFDDDNLLSFKDMLDNFEILYEEVPAGGGRPARYVINASDVPSQEVKSFYIKEAWYFDQNNSLFDVKTLAICPIAFRISDIGEQRTPMFWTRYEDIRPYIKSNYIMTSNLNNAKTYTIDDFFRQRMFDGPIVKTENLMNLALQQMYPDPDTLKIEQQKIEDQLLSFNDSLWIKPDTTIVLSKKEQKKLEKASRRAAKSDGVTSDDKKTASKATKEPKAEKSASSKSAPTRSIRRN